MPKKILLVCSSGMSTSLLKKKMEKSAQEKGLDVVIDAVGAERFEVEHPSASIVLLGPQLRFKKDEYERILGEHGKKLAVIEPADYGMMNGEKVLAMALELLGK